MSWYSFLSYIHRSAISIGYLNEKQTNYQWREILLSNLFSVLFYYSKPYRKPDFTVFKWNDQRFKLYTSAKNKYYCSERRSLKQNGAAMYWKLTVRIGFYVHCKDWKFDILTFSLIKNCPKCTPRVGKFKRNCT